MKATVLRCRTVDAHGHRQFFDGDKLVFALVDGSYVERRHLLGYSPPFLQILPCPYCGATEDLGWDGGGLKGHDKARHTASHALTRLAP